ncbi:hypothetical protein OSB04_017295 [Centaurea solstitialis]|uniref:Reverse transcriptase Ty1/copia-type domain-containing protein n=1 Tax=Centaurea solstitialis TaxID=347529 RepID=A0AA38WI83_9ASTR|nr:hypothetical protein OSB04_017295 [Centaurea solstitialis]
MTTRANAGIFKPCHRADLSHTTNHALHHALFASSDSKTFKTAVKDPKWIHAMRRKLDALHQNNTRSLVPRPVNRNVVGLKWVFRTKYHYDGAIDRHKARLVAHGFSQISGLDFAHTFSPVVKSSTIRIVISLAVINSRKLHQLEVNNAFLHGHLNECVHMEQPLGFVHPGFPNHVCKNLLFGELNYFIGLEITYTANRLFLNQSKHAKDIFARAQMLDGKLAPTPLATNTSFTTSGEPFPDPSHYRSIVGSLQYLTITRADLSYVVNQVILHYQEVKHILRYLKGNLTFGLTFSKPSHTSLLGYSDADWGLVVSKLVGPPIWLLFFLEGNLVSWGTKKQLTVSRFSCESEYLAMANTAIKIVWITHLLRELHALPPDHPTILCDNRSALFLT